jgi:hypothetical protein
MPCPDDTLLALYVALRDLDADPHPVPLTLAPLDAWILLTQLQLALRHPGNQGQAAARTRAIAAQLEAAVASAEPLRTLAAQGWDPAYDVSWEGRAP